MIDRRSRYATTPVLAAGTTADGGTATRASSTCACADPPGSVLQIVPDALRPARPAGLALLPRRDPLLADLRRHAPSSIPSTSSPRRARCRSRRTRSHAKPTDQRPLRRHRARPGGARAAQPRARCARATATRRVLALRFSLVPARQRRVRPARRRPVRAGRGDQLRGRAARRDHSSASSRAPSPTCARTSRPSVPTPISRCWRWTPRCCSTPRRRSPPGRTSTTATWSRQMLSGLPDHGAGRRHPGPVRRGPPAADPARHRLAVPPAPGAAQRRALLLRVRRRPAPGGRPFRPARRQRPAAAGRRACCRTPRT